MIYEGRKVNCGKGNKTAWKVINTSRHISTKGMLKAFRSFNSRNVAVGRGN